MKKKLFLIGLSLTLLSACNYLMSKDLQDPPAPQGPSKAQASGMSFQKVFDETLKPRCLDCHSNAHSAAGVNVEDYNNVFANRESIRDAVATARMPLRRPALTPAEKEMLFQWIDAGAPKDGPVAEQPAPAPAPPTPAPTPTPLPEPPAQPPVPGETPPSNPSEALNFAKVRDSVLAPRCLKCHSEAGGNRGDINLETFEHVKSVLSEISEEVSTDQMPPRKPLTAEEKSLLLTWIQNGAPE